MRHSVIAFPAISNELFFRTKTIPPELESIYCGVSLERRIRKWYVDGDW